MSLETVPQEILDNIFSYLTESQPRPHPLHYPVRLPVFPQISKDQLFTADGKLTHVYNDIALVSRKLRLAIEAYAKHLLSISVSADDVCVTDECFYTAWEGMLASPHIRNFSFRVLLCYVASAKAVCIFCLRIYRWPREDADAAEFHGIVQTCPECELKLRMWGDASIPSQAV